MTAYYNEHDPKAAAWLRELIKQGHIAPGVVDERSLEDITPSDLEEYTQCHFFAGIGVWSYALRRAGWPDDKPVWTGSCPCQPFSAAGKGAGMSDERHLWPAWYHLITQCEPGVIFGEQVASKDGLGWLDLVQADLEGAGYTNGAIDLCAAGVGAPHIRQRLWFIAERVGNTFDTGLERLPGDVLDGYEPGRIDTQPDRSTAETGGRGRLADTTNDRDLRRPRQILRAHEEQQTREEPGEDNPRQRRDSCRNDREGQPRPTNGFWRDVDWLFCRDEKWRPVEPGTSPLVNGAAARVVRLRGYGNAINVEVATTFIVAAIDSLAS